VRLALCSCAALNTISDVALRSGGPRSELVQRQALASAVNNTSATAANARAHGLCFVIFVPRFAVPFCLLAVV
jgi:hypothetical protein